MKPLGPIPAGFAGRDGVLTIDGAKVTELIAQGLPVSMRLGLSAIALAVLIGTSLGVTAALRQNSTVDYAVMSVAMTGIASRASAVAIRCIRLAHDGIRRANAGVGTAARRAAAVDVRGPASAANRKNDHCQK